ncbi:hypothetical protein GGI35DRAFT_454380 [Trichoderma velutinum]
MISRFLDYFLSIDVKLTQTEGTDVILASLSALSSSVEEVEVLLRTLLYGNVAPEKYVRLMKLDAPANTLY